MPLKNGRPHAAFTLFHVLWLVVSAAVPVLVYFSLQHASPLPRILVSAAAFLIAVVLTHLVIVFIVTTWVIPRLTPDSLWSREVDAYMASVFPGKWGNPPE